MSAREELVEALYPLHEAERSYVAALLTRDDTNDVMWRSDVEPHHFENGDYARILEAMLAVRDRSEKVHFLTVAEELADVRVEAVMWNSTNHWANPGFVEFFADQVMARYRRRSVKDLSAALGAVAEEVSGVELDSAVEHAVDEVLAKPAVRSAAPTTNLAGRAFGARDQDKPLPTPFAALNRAIKGFRPGALYTLSGDTGSGKSAVALQLAYGLAQHGTVLYHTLEMTGGEQQDRVIAQQCGVALDMVERQFYPEGPIRDRVTDFVQQPVNIAFDERTSVTVSEVRRTALGLGQGLAAIVVDQLPLMDLGLKRGENLADGIGRAVYGLKNMAADLGVPVVMLTQLNREASRAGRPTRHHLYGSSAIANAANVILILHREDLSEPHRLSLIVDKNRYGEEGVLDLRWEGGFVRAASLES